MTRILGIDPGSRITGFGIIDFVGTQSRYVASGSIQVKGETLSDRLRVIFENLDTVIQTHLPNECAIEQVFVHKNAASALKLGHARGVAMVAANLKLLAVHEYTPTQIKQSVTGRGRANKEQVQHMIRVLLNLNKVPATDAADALAVALCHAHTRSTLDAIDRSARRVAL